jgi:hypothetical protein
VIEADGRSIYTVVDLNAEPLPVLRPPVPYLLGRGGELPTGLAEAALDILDGYNALALVAGVVLPFACHA